MSVCYSVSKRVIDTHKWLQPTRHTHPGRTLCDMCRSVTEKNFVDLGGCGAWRFLCLASLTSRVHSERERARDQERRKEGRRDGAKRERRRRVTFLAVELTLHSETAHLTLALNPLLAQARVSVCLLPAS